MNIKRAELPVVNVEANRLSFERSDPFISMFTGVKTQPFMSRFAQPFWRGKKLRNRPIRFSLYSSVSLKFHV